MKKRIILLLLCVLTLAVSLCLFTACKKDEALDNGDGTTEGGGTSDGGSNDGGTTEGGEIGTGGTVEPTKTSEGLVYELSDDGTYYTVTGKGSCLDTDIVIPSIYKDKPVTIIGDFAFSNCSSLTSVVIGNSVTTIGDYAFAYCDSLTSVVIPDSVTSIGSNAFNDCDSLTSVTIPDSVTLIGDYAFKYCYKLVEVINKSSLNVTKTSYGLNALEVHYGESKIVNKNGYLFITSSGVNYLLGYTGTDTVLILPNDYHGESYNIYGFAFYCNDKITSVVIPNSVTTIGSSAFCGCSSLTNVTIGNGVTTIDDYAFWSCYSLTSVTIGNSVTSIGGYAFEDCDKLVEVINKSSRKITKGSESNGYVGKYALEIHNGESKIVDKDGYLFITYDGVNYLLGYVGTDTALTLPNGFNGQNYEIYQYAFYNNDKITSVVISDSVTSIGDDAFAYCGSLTSVTIPNSVIKIDDCAFWSCYKLVEVINKSSLTITKRSRDYGNVGESALEIHNGESKIVNKDGYLFITYNGVNYLLGYAGTDTAFTLPSDYNGQNYEIYEYAFRYNNKITSVVIPNSVKRIGSYAFSNCSSLTSVVIGNSVTSIGYEAFESCSSLTSVTIGNSVTSIGSFAFSSCSSLTSIKYRGTQTQWNAISKSSYWNHNTGNCTITYNYTGE